MLNITKLEAIVKEVREISEQGMAELPYNHELFVAFRNEEIPGMDLILETDYDRDVMVFGVDAEWGDEVVVETELNINPDGVPEKGQTVGVIVTALESILDRVKSNGSLDEE